MMMMMMMMIPMALLTLDNENVDDAPTQMMI
jgi:hypothetical protein